ncbi:hemolysin XhlA family protein [Fictibacillus phosphorivorans]|uniref:hemolysin XhlA family protein n=1 Tax=Fictibacillus phosphorivorans TaxID=1221500 RepID=UPI0035E649A7
MEPVEKLEERMVKIEERQAAIETRVTLAESHIKDIKGDLRDIKGDTKWLVKLVGGSLIVGVITGLGFVAKYILQGGL